MNYGWLEPDTELREYQRVVRHEFGHALGMIHEHQNPAAAGETLEIYGLGLGITSPAPEAGLPSPLSPLARVVQTPRVQIGNRDAAVTFAGLTPVIAGVYQVNAIVPAGLAPGLHSVVWMGPEGPLNSASIAVK